MRKVRPAFVFYPLRVVSLVTMRLAIGIDTGGTCTDAVVYRLEDRQILACAKSPTTHENLSKGIGNVISKLPDDLIQAAEVVALSTTLATNACVEGKGGRAKLVFFGVSPQNVRRVGPECGLSADDDDIVYVECKTKINGEVVEPPDWEEFEERLHERFDECDAVGVVEMYARKSGANLEKRAAALIKEQIGIPVVCGYSLFNEYNIIKRGASALLNARLLSVIDRFLKAVGTVMEERGINAPVVIVRSDGSLMTGEFTATRPVETLLCGPVASVMGAMELCDEKDALVVDIGGTTTDVAFVKNGLPQRVKSGVRIGSWDTFVKGLSVDTFGLGGDSGVIVDPSTDELVLEDSKIMPLCMAAVQYPSMINLLKREDFSRSRVNNQRKHIYVSLRDISEKKFYTARERAIAAALAEPKTLESLNDVLGETVLEYHIERLVREGVLIRCGVTPTDAMHFKGDFEAYSKEASQLGLNIMARIVGCDPVQLAEDIYDVFKKKLYCNLVRILIEDAFPSIRETGVGGALGELIADSYEQVKTGSPREFLSARFATPAALVGVGAPTSLFLPDVAAMLGAKYVGDEHSSVANALGAAVGKVRTAVTFEVRYQPESDTYVVFGFGERVVCETLNPAKELAKGFSKRYAEQEAVKMGADPDSMECSYEEEELGVDTDFGVVYLGYTVTTKVQARLRLN